VESGGRLSAVQLEWFWCSLLGLPVLSIPTPQWTPLYFRRAEERELACCLGVWSATRKPQDCCCPHSIAVLLAGQKHKRPEAHELCRADVCTVSAAICVRASKTRSIGKDIRGIMMQSMAFVRVLFEALSWGFCFFCGVKEDERKKMWGARIETTTKVWAVFAVMLFFSTFVLENDVFLLLRLAREIYRKRSGGSDLIC
jgi:preprotein translocase subunit SecE